MTNKELYEKIYIGVRAKGITISQFCSDITKETGKKPNLYITKDRDVLPNTVMFPYLKQFLTDDEMHEITLKKIERTKAQVEEVYLLDDILYNLKPSKEYLYKQRMKRKMQREGSI